MTPDGCGWCRGHYYAWSNEVPELIANLDDGERSLRRCRRCGTYWLENVFTHPRPIGPDDAEKLRAL